MASASRSMPTGACRSSRASGPSGGDFKTALAQEVDAFRSTGCDWNATVAQLIGRHSLLALLQARGASREVIAMAESLRGFFLADPDQLSALVGVEQATQSKDPGHVTVSRIKGGNERLVQAPAKQKGVRISLGSAVTRIAHDRRGVRVVVADGSKRCRPVPPRRRTCGSTRDGGESRDGRARGARTSRVARCGNIPAPDPRA